MGAKFLHVRLPGGNVTKVGLDVHHAALQQFLARVVQVAAGRLVHVQKAAGGWVDDKNAVGGLVEQIMKEPKPGLRLLAHSDVAVHAAVTAERPLCIQDRHAIGLEHHEAAILVAVDVLPHVDRAFFGYQT